MKINQINFTSLKIRGDALVKLAQLTSGNSTETQETYNHLKDISKTLSYDLLIESDNNDGILVSKLAPLSSDKVEIARNKNFTQGMQDAIEYVEQNEIKLRIPDLTTDLYRQRILMQMNSME